MIGERLLALRTDADLTQDELGQALNINKHSISSYERDKSEPDDETKVRIARYFNVSLDYLLGITDEPIPLRSEIGTVVRLPVQLPAAGKRELKDFIGYLMHKYGQKG